VTFIPELLDDVHLKQVPKGTELIVTLMGSEKVNTTARVIAVLDLHAVPEVNNKAITALLATESRTIVAKTLAKLL